MSPTNPTLIIGNGKMGQEYARLYRDGLKRPFFVAGRSRARIDAFKNSVGAQGALVFDEMENSAFRNYDTIVVAVSEQNLEPITERLLESGAKRILLEKPGSLNVTGAKKIADLADRQGAYVRIACNRRYYPSVLKMKAILREEKALSATFEFTEIVKQIGSLDKPAEVKARWGLINPIHVVDTLGFVLGPISDLEARHSGAGKIAWHPSSSLFHGSATAGETPVSYLTNWLSPGRWDLQIMTENGRYKLSPMEKLVVMRHDSKFQWIDVPTETTPGDAFKPGLYDMVSSFDEGNPCELPDLHENARTLELLSNVFGYPV